MKKLASLLQKDEQKLYSDVPPTKTRNRNEKFRKAVDSKFWTWVAKRFFYRMLENRFYSLKIKNKENLEKRNPNYANILYAPHCNWWDGIVGYNLVKRVVDTRIRMMIEEMNRFPILAKAGAFPVNKKSAQASMQALQYAVDQLSKGDISLWIFPQGIIRPPMFRPIEFQTGMAYIAKNVIKKYGGINLIPVAINYSFLREDKPEVLVEFGEPYVLTDANIDRRELTNTLQADFEQLCDNQFANIRNGNFEGYEYLFRQKLKWYRRLEKRLKKIDMPPGSGV